MKIVKRFARSLFLAVILWNVAAASRTDATELTFDIFTDAGKTTRLPNGAFIPQAYGDNVSDFSPDFYTYGSAGGATPHITVEYRFLSAVNPTDPNPGINGPPNGLIYDNDYGDLQYVVYDLHGSTLPDTWFQEIRFNSTLEYRVTLESFDIAGWNQSNIGGQTLKIVRDANSPSAAVLWSAGPDGTVTVTGSGPSHDSYTPNVTVADGHTLSLIYGKSVNIGVDNIVFSESIPEPSGLVLVSLAVAGWMLRRRASSANP